MRVRLLLALGLLSGCLDSPPAGVVEADGGAADGGSDAAPGADGAIGACRGSLYLPLTSEADVAGWGVTDGRFCSYGFTGTGLEFINDGSPSTCSLHSDKLVDLTGNRLSVRLTDANASLSMTFSVVVGSPEIAFNDRRWIYFERDDGKLQFGECSPDIGGCSDTYWGSVTYNPELHRWLSFSRELGGDSLVLETSDDGVTFGARAAPNQVLPEDVLCVGVDLGSYEVGSIGTATSSSFSDLRTN